MPVQQAHVFPALVHADLCPAFATIVLLQIRLSNGTLTYKQLTDPLAVQPDATKLQVSTATLPEGAMYIAKVGGTLWHCQRACHVTRDSIVPAYHTPCPALLPCSRRNVVVGS
jgi:hypothetical protein